LGRIHTRCRVRFGGFYLRFGDDTTGENFINLSAAHDRGGRLDNYVSTRMRLEN
jgi:hypothetical protein